MAKTTRAAAKRKAVPGKLAGSEASDTASLSATIEDAILKCLEERVTGGDAHALLVAVDHYIRTGRRVPLVFAQPFLDRIDEWFRNQAETLDEAFKVQRPKGQHFDELKKRFGLRPSILLRVLHIQRAEKLPIGDEIFDKVGRQLGETARYVRDIWYDKESKLMRAYLRKAERITLA
jgi:hypothetical protein